MIGSEDTTHELSRGQDNFLQWKASAGYPQIGPCRFYPDGTLRVECVDGVWLVNRDGEEEEA
jgi:hypothetical protein